MISLQMGEASLIYLFDPIGRVLVKVVALVNLALANVRPRLGEPEAL